MAAPKAPAAPAAPDVLEDIAAKAPEGLLLPARHVRDLIEKTAGYVVRNGPSFEQKIRASTTTTGFMDSGDPYNPYYAWRLAEIRAGRGSDISAGRAKDSSKAQVAEGGVGGDWQGRETTGPPKPEEFRFSARMPNISAQDLEVVKLTALFAAKNGQSWISQLAQREAGNFQFDFLRPQHSLYQFFKRLQEQYTDLLNGGIVDGGRPLKRRKDELHANIDDRFGILERAKKRAEWVRYQESQKVAQAEEEEKEKVAYQQIDWHDFVVVETVLFDERDEEVLLPAPTTLNDLQSASLEQKAAMRVGADRRIEEAMPSFDDYPAFYGNGAPEQQPVRMPNHPAPQQPYTPTPPQATPFVPPEDITSRITTAQQERERARAAQEAARAAPTNLKIRNDYVPRAQAKRQQASAAGTSICPNCKQAIPNDEMEQHLRIEMIDPNWKENARKAQERSATTNLSVQDVAGNLKRLASQRKDLFDPTTGDPLSEEERERRKRAELSSYDGVSGMPSQTAFQGMSTVAPGVAAPGTDAQQQQEQQPADVQEQIRMLHQKYRT